jgi:hypothetical protein
MIASGEKTEEYREIKPYWANRFCYGMSDTDIKVANIDGLQKELKTTSGTTIFDAIKKDWDAVKFTNGYSKNAPTMTVNFKGIEIGKAKPEWSDNWQGEVFIIKLGKIIPPNDRGE